MPNYVKNIIKIQASTPERAAKVISEICNSNGHVDFNTLIPMPPELNTGFHDLDAAFIARGNAPKHPISDESAALVDQYKANLNKHGACTWSEWAPDAWGTKWNACHSKVGDACVEFDTAWSAPGPIFVALAAKFPDVNFTVYYADEDRGSNCGVVLISGGKVQRVWNPETLKKDAYFLAGAVWGVDWVNVPDEE